MLDSVRIGYVKRAGANTKERTMSVTEMLVAEHETVLKKLEEIRNAAISGNVAGVATLLPFFEKDIQLHRRKEEEVLFPAIVRVCGEDGSPVGCMLEEHRIEKGLVERIRKDLDGEGGKGASRTLAADVEEFVDFLRFHIRKENEVLFPLAESVLSPGEKEIVFDGMRRIGACCDVCAGHRAKEPV